MSLILKWRQFLNKGHERTVRAKKNVLLSLVFKAVGIGIGFLYFPLSLSYLDPVRFGIFLTLASIIDWFTELDVGIGNGLFNRLGEALADGDDERARGYISTTYFFVGSIFGGVALLFMSVSYFLPWSEWLQADPALNHEIAILAVFMFGALAVRFISSLVYQVFYALQRTAMVHLFNMVSKLSFLFIILYLLYFTEDSLMLYGLAKTFTFASVPLLVGIFFFRGKFKRFRPGLRYVKRSYFKDLFTLGLKFFVIKISLLLIYQTNNFLIARYASLESVAEYGAAYKYLSVFLILFMILSNQVWSANIEAYRKQDMAWMKKTKKSLLGIWGLTILGSIFLVAVSPFLFDIWLQDKIQIPLLLTIAVAVSVATTNWVNMHHIVVNSTGKVKLQMIIWIIASVANIPLSIFFAQYLGMGTVGIVLGTIVSLLPLAVISPIQVRMLLNRSDRGIWSK